MGLTAGSTGRGAADSKLKAEKERPTDKLIALAGNPNVGKSTVFNLLTGCRQHTGNWAGKTVTNAMGRCRSDNNDCLLIDIPGTYSLAARSKEEQVARDFICFGGADSTVVVCDATCIERNLNLVLQILEYSGNAAVCVNLIDEAKRKNITVDTKLLAERLCVPVCKTAARSRKSKDTLRSLLDSSVTADAPPRKISYPAGIEQAISMISPTLTGVPPEKRRWLSVRLIENDTLWLETIKEHTGFVPGKETEKAVGLAREMLFSLGFTDDGIKEEIVTALVKEAENICRGAVTVRGNGYNGRDRRLDRIFTSRLTGFPVMILLLAVIFWITVAGANYPSLMLSAAFDRLGALLLRFMLFVKAPPWLCGIVCDGIYRVLSWVVAVMLPPMAIFFPLFTLLEDAGYLPRVAYNLDKPFRLCGACGKQALTVSMGFGCNAAGVVGARIIDSPRERLLAILTNSLVPCNGRFPAMISVIGMFFVLSKGGFSSVLSALCLTAVILLGLAVTFAATKLLSKTLLRGVPSSFTLELPSYRRPQIGKVLLHSVADRTVFVLGRAAAVAAPAGALLWLAANIHPGGIPLITRCASFIDPFARMIGLDGTILIAFILGLPANEIVLPIVIMAYTSSGVLEAAAGTDGIFSLLTANGWTPVTAVCFVVFSLMHWPCSTTLMTVKKETGSIKWTLLAFLLPTVCGTVLCFLINTAAGLL